MTSTFFTDFLKISDILTIIFIAVLLATFFLVGLMKKKRFSFSKRVLLATALGLIIGIVMQIAAGFPEDPNEVVFISESATWYGLFGNGFIYLIRMLVIPLIMVSIIHVIINMEGANLGKVAAVGVGVTMAMVAISVIVGLVLGLIFNLGQGVSVVEGASEIKEIQPIVTTLLGLLPSNPVTAMTESNIIALVIFSAFFGIGAKRMSKKHMDTVKPFFDLINALHKIITSVAISIIKLMPYAVVAMLAATIAQRGMSSILEVIKFIGVLYLAVAVMFIIQLISLMVSGIKPVTYIRKGLETLIMAFTSRSSVGTLPLTISTLTNKMGVSEGTANFVASFGTTAGMQGCAGVFPSLLVVFVANMSGTSIDITFIIMAVIVIGIGSLGIAGIPGTATMAASVSLSGTGLGSYFPMISPILAIDPIVDMGRTFLNVSGAMVNSLIVDKSLGLMNKDDYNNLDLAKLSDEEDVSLD